jgi:hypothetical protein
MKPIKIFIAVLVMASVLQSCSIRSSQVSSLTAMYKEPLVDLKAHSWTLSFGEYSALVYAVSISEGTLFSNQFGDSLLFDGWSFREINGLGINRANWKISDGQAVRQFYRGNRLVAEHLCDPWLSTKGVGLIRFSQDCRSFMPQTNSILINDEGHITFIRQIVDGGNTFLTVSKNK